MEEQLQQQHRSASGISKATEEQQQLQQQHRSASATATSTTTTTLPTEEQQEVQQSRRRNASPTASQLVDNEQVMEDTYHSESIVASPSSHSRRSKSKSIKYYSERDMDEDSEEEFFIGSDHSEVSDEDSVDNQRKYEILNLTYIPNDASYSVFYIFF
jgi:hypothetical protein